MLFDQQRCFGCNACVVACQQEYGLPAQIRFNRVDVTVSGTFPSTSITFRPLLCNQCDNAPCMAICPVTAISRDATTGVVLTDRARCVGCRLCTTTQGCPYGMRAIDGAGKAVKCNFCLDRRAAGETAPYCVKTCPSGARQEATGVSPPPGTRMESRGGATPKVFYGTI
jgi:tetrathionate reductase subunit B